MTPATSTPLFSRVGEKLTARTGILELMDDLGRAMTVEPDMRMLGNYEPPQGNPRFLRALAALLQRSLGWDIGPQNLVVTSGGQTALFFLFNLLAGRVDGRRSRKILLPLSPEYIGYADQGVEEDLFVSCRPDITWPEGEAARVFKYRINFATVEAALGAHDIAAIAVSRPTNPSGNVITDAEVRRLAALAEAHSIPLILDGAYGAPFPNVMFVPAEPFWAPHVILTLSLSKLGLPGSRTAVVVAPEAVASALTAMNAVVGLANNNVGQQLVLPWIEDGRLLELGPKLLRPFYEQRGRATAAFARECLDRAGVDWALHAGEGAFFHWLWLRGLRVTTRELYQRLKARRVLVVPGEYFFFGLDHDWPHRHECLRISYTQPEEVVREGLAIIADEAAKQGQG